MRDQDLNRTKAVRGKLIQEGILPDVRSSAHVLWLRRDFLGQQPQMTEQTTTLTDANGVQSTVKIQVEDPTKDPIQYMPPFELAKDTILDKRRIDGASSERDGRWRQEHKWHVRQQTID